MTLEKLLDKATTIHGNKYDYSKVVFTRMQDEVVIVCPEHGEFFQKPAVHINDKCGCPICGYANRQHPQQKTTAQFIAEAKKIHGNKYNYSLVNYKNAYTDVQIICLIHGMFSQRPEAHVNQKHGCLECGYLNRKIPHQKTTEQFVAQAKNKWGDIYNYTKTVYVNKQTKIVYECSKHGVIEQKPNLHLRSGCPYCNGRGISRHNLTSFLNLASRIHDNRYDYSLVKLNRITDYIKIICAKHGEFEQCASNHIHLENGCPQCIHIISKPEKELLSLIESCYCGQILNNDRIVLDGKEIDIYLPELRIGFEYHGMYWHLETAVGRKLHCLKANKADDADIQLIQIYEHEWKNKQNIVKSKINCMLGKAHRIAARKTVIKKIDINEKNLFLDKTHIKGRDNSNVAYGLYYEGLLVACMTFGASRFNPGYDYELVRFSSAINTVVIGGAAKLLQAFRKEKVGSIISYADRRWSKGNLYRKLNFSLDGLTKPSFSYYHVNKQTFHSRLSFQKHMLKNMPGYDDDLTEYEIMQLNGYDRIWDAGQYRFVLE